MKFVHSADWQLGARFSQFGAKSGALRQARLDTLKAVLRAARDRQVDAFIIAGDLFEDNQVDDSLVASVLELFKEFGTVPFLSFLETTIHTRDQTRSGAGACL